MIVREQGCLIGDAPAVGKFGVELLERRLNSLAIATHMQVMRRVMLPLLTPAVFASAVLVFSSVIDDFVLVDLLNSNSGNTPMSVYIYAQQKGGNGRPALNALGTIMLVMSLAIVIIGYIGYRWMIRGERGGQVEALTTIAGTD